VSDLAGEIPGPSLLGEGH